jgi:hypothetical protein
MDPVPLAIAGIPLAVYLLALGAINLRRRPLVVNGPADIGALAAALVGLVFVGPLNLFLPQASVIRFGPLVWLILLVFYGLCVLLYMLVARPRLVIFNVIPEQIRDTLQEVCRKLDSDTTLAGDAVHLPRLGVQLHFDFSPGMRNVALVATGDQQSFSGWKRLHHELATALQRVEVPPNPRGFTLLTTGLVLIGWPLVQLLQMPGTVVAQQLKDILRM